MRKLGIVGLALLVLSLMVFALSGCGKGQESKGNAGKPAGQSAPTAISISSGGTSGNYYIGASAIADVLTKKAGIQATAQVTGAAAENARLTGKGKTLLGMLTADVAYEAYRGLGTWEKEKMDNLRAIMPGFVAQNHILVKADSSIQTLQDLKGKKVSLGAPGSGTYSQNLILLTAMGLTVEDVKPQNISFAESVEALKDGNLDAALMLSAYPFPAVMDFTNTTAGRLIEVPADVQKAIKGKYPYENILEIPGGIYKGIDKAIPTYGYVNWLITTKEADEETIYKITKTIIESNDDLKAVSQSAADWGTKYIDGSDYPMPLHPGAERYLKEKGIQFKIAN